jgi:hypothetical protein
MPVWPPRAFTSGLPIPGSPEIAGYSYGATWGLAPAGLAPASLTVSFAALPPPGPPRRVPRPPRYYGAVRLPGPLTPRFVAFAWRYQALCPSLRSRRPGHPTAGLGFVTRTPPPGRIAWRPPGPPKFPENPGVHLPCSPTPAGSTRQALQRYRCSPRPDNNEGSHEDDFGAPSHGFCTGCLRFVPGIAARDARLASRCWPLYGAGLVTRRILSKGFRW